MKNVFFLMMLVVLSACSSADNKNESVNIIQAPQWVSKNASVNNPYSAIGLTDKKGSIKDVIKYAEDNALANLKPAIAVKLDSFFDDEIVSFNSDKQSEYKTRFKYVIDNVMRTMPVDRISRREAMWVSPDNDTTYVMMVVDKPFIVKYLTNELNAIEKTYKYDEEFITLLKEVKEDVSVGLIARKRTPYQEVKNKNMYATENVNNTNTEDVGVLIDDDKINALMDTQQEKPENKQAQ